MEHSKQRIEHLIDAYLAGKATAGERAQLERLYAKAALNSPYVDDLETAQLYELKKEGLLKVIAEIRKGKIKRFTIVKRVVLAAAAVAAIVLGVWFYNARYAGGSNATRNLPNYANDIAPGGNRATLTLANGKTVTLSDVKTGVIVNDDLKYNDGTTVIPDAAKDVPDGTTKPIVAATPRGGTYTFTLPDGTKVWLNAASKISFPLQFIGVERKILLEGEAYFEVAKNKAKPFIVESKGQRVEVLGTHFNINSYSDENSVKTTLLEGSVKVIPFSLSAPSSRGQRSKGRSPDAVILKPNQEAVLTGKEEITVKPVDASLAVAWKNNKFIFANQPIQDVMRMVARWYNVEVIYPGAIPDAKFRGSVSRFDSVSKVLRMLESTGSAHFKIEGRKIYVYP
uniref:FecR family protein n=1 Tax=Pedobacter schmidteae TaxID=2201271 RepID=UPI000EAD0BE4|nr:FecR domain-containing protein [Pedobacter schmidteae]